MQSGKLFSFFETFVDGTAAAHEGVVSAMVEADYHAYRNSLEPDKRDLLPPLPTILKSMTTSVDPSPSNVSEVQSIDLPTHCVINRSKNLPCWELHRSWCVKFGIDYTDPSICKLDARRFHGLVWKHMKEGGRSQSELANLTAACRAAQETIGHVVKSKKHRAQSDKDVQNVSHQPQNVYDEALTPKSLQSPSTSSACGGFPSGGQEECTPLSADRRVCGGKSPGFYGQNANGFYQVSNSSSCSESSCSRSSSSSSSSADR